jgi:GT2 family glycosyltransferase
MSERLPTTTLSIVSHAQNSLVNQLLRDLAAHGRAGAPIVVTENVPDAVALDVPAGLRVERIRNDAPKGFGANHNVAFRRCTTSVFVVLNPDIRLAGDPFAALAARVLEGQVGAAGPLVRSPQGTIEDSARRFPTALGLMKKAFGPPRGPDYPVDRGAVDVDWVAGMCMALRREAFEAAKGFDERYFLYYEDVDLCRRLQRLGYRVIYDPAVSVVHDARRTSRRDARLAWVHAASAIRFLRG